MPQPAEDHATLVALMTGRWPFWPGCGANASKWPALMPGSLKLRRMGIRASSTSASLFRRENPFCSLLRQRIGVDGHRPIVPS